MQHDPFGTLLGVFLLAGLVISALPQIIRMVRKGNSFGYSPWFLLLGSTSSASAWVNVVALQWGVVRCCPTLGVGLCLEGLLGAIQVGVQWGLGFLLCVWAITIYISSSLSFFFFLSSSPFLSSPCPV